MAREDLKPVRTKEEAKIRGRAGGIASAAARRERKSFEATLKAILDTPMEELESLSPRLAICKGMIDQGAPAPAGERGEKGPLGDAPWATCFGHFRLSDANLLLDYTGATLDSAFSVNANGQLEVTF